MAKCGTEQDSVWPHGKATDITEENGDDEHDQGFGFANGAAPKRPRAMSSTAPTSVLGFASEFKDGRVTVFGFKSMADFKRWTVAIAPFIPATAIGDVGRRMMLSTAKSLELLKTSTKDVKQLVIECGPHQVTPHDTNILYLDICIKVGQIPHATARPTVLLLVFAAWPLLHR